MLHAVCRLPSAVCRLLHRMTLCAGEVSKLRACDCVLILRSPALAVEHDVPCSQANHKVNFQTGEPCPKRGQPGAHAAVPALEPPPPPHKPNEVIKKLAAVVDRTWPALTRAPTPAPTPPPRAKPSPAPSPPLPPPPTPPPRVPRAPGVAAGADEPPGPGQGPWVHKGLPDFHNPNGRLALVVPIRDAVNALSQGTQ